jgi:hypothetical protein
MGHYIKLPWDVWVTVKTDALNKMCMLLKVYFYQFVRRVINVFRYSVKMQWFHIHNCYMYVILENYTVAARWDQQFVMSHYPDSEPTSLYYFSFTLRAYWRSNISNWKIVLQQCIHYIHHWTTFASDIDVTSKILLYKLLISSCSHSIILKPIST